MTAPKSKTETHSAAVSSALLDEERVFHRDRLREARYAALADAEAFQQMCFAIEALGKRLNPKAKGLGECRSQLEKLAHSSALLPSDVDEQRAIKPFHALFTSIKEARNDAMHTGAYARHVAADALTLCLVLEDALMMEKNPAEAGKRLTVGDFMVSTPTVVHPWQTVEHARQLMLLYSFSYLPIWHQDRWWLVSDMGMAGYLRPHWPALARLKKTLAQAQEEGLPFARASSVRKGDAVVDLLSKPRRPGLWLVKEKGYPPGHLAGVLSPFELM
jgi:hypothetical protein